MPLPPRHIVGCMTGTSLDGLDVALVEITGHAFTLTARLIAHQSQPLGPVRDELLALASHKPHAPADYLRTARRFGALHAEAVYALCRQHMPADARLHLVAAHGQTICHLPAENLSWQLFDPWPVSRRLGVPVVHDLRQADLIAGGEGAPITPIADWIAFRDVSRSRAVVNLGGICNVTHLPAQGSPADITGRDVGPCNLLLDGLAQRLFNTPYDTDGQHAASGRAHDTVTARVQQHIAAALDQAGTLGREQFANDWLDALLREIETRDAAPADLLASSIEAVAQRIAMHDTVVNADEVIVAGGGSKNPVLMRALQRDLGSRSVQQSGAFGIPPEAREAFAMAVLGALCEDGCAITFSKVTGAHNPGIAGAWISG